MTITCPCCRANNDNSPCRRCKADLGLLIGLESERERLVQLAAKLLGERQWIPAQQALHQAEELRAGVDLDPLRAILALLQGDPQAALTAYHHWNQFRPRSTQTP